MEVFVKELAARAKLVIDADELSAAIDKTAVCVSVTVTGA